MTVPVVEEMPAQPQFVQSIVTTPKSSGAPATELVPTPDNGRFDKLEVD